MVIWLSRVYGHETRNDATAEQLAIPVASRQAVEESHCQARRARGDEMEGKW